MKTCFLIGHREAPQRLLPVLETISRRLAILRANQAAVDRADYLITYVCHPASNAGNLMTYARKRGKTITNIGALE